MEYYSELCVPTENMLQEYVQPYIIPNQADSEYEIRHTMLVDGGDRFGVSSVVFDKHEELIWMGNQGGHITSYYGPNMQKYTSFQIHESEEVRDILTTKEGIYALTKSILRHQIRRGLPKFTHRSANMKDMQCLYQSNTSKILIGGHQDMMIEIDLTKKTETLFPITEGGCVVLRGGGGSIVACGSANGLVSLRDLRSPSKAEQMIQAHTACLSDLDMQGDMLITCGFTQTGTGVTQAESSVLVWDARSLRSPRLCSSLVAPRLLHFLPAFSARAVAAASDGHVELLTLNVSSKHEHSVFKVDTQSTVCSVMDVSASSQALVFGDQSGHLHLFSARHNNEPVFNSFSRSTEFADSPPDIPFVSFKDTKFQFSRIPLPQLSSDSRWFNELPTEFFKKYYRKPKLVDDEVLRTMKMKGPIGYAPNPGTHKRNQMPYEMDTLEDLKYSRNETKIISEPVPKQYQKIDIKLSKNSPKEDFQTYNKTPYPGLEATLPNSYCNAMLQVLYYIPAVKSTLYAHTCAKEFCLSCELGFLFRMLDSSNGSPCQATNFLRAFRTVPEAAALGLILPDRAIDFRVDLVGLIQSWNRFILHQIHYEIIDANKKVLNTSSPIKVNHATVNKEKIAKEIEFIEVETQWNGQEGINGTIDGRDGIETGKVDSEISDLFAIGRYQQNKCLKCNKEEERESFALACALSVCVRVCAWRFCSLVSSSLVWRRSTPAWCEHCHKFTPTMQHATAFRLPPILAINCGSLAACKGNQNQSKDLPDGKRNGSAKPCRYGLQCARPGCRFKHPDRPGSASYSPSSPSRESQYVLPYNLSIRLSADGEITVNDKYEQQTEMQTAKNGNGHTKKKYFTPTESSYTLSAAVVCVEDNPRNLVSYIRVGGSEEDPQWVLFNDLSIVPVNVEEVVNFSPWWKSPCVLFYTNNDTNEISANGNTSTRS